MGCQSRILRGNVGRSVLTTYHATQKPALHTDVCLYGSLTDWIGSLTETCRGRAVKRHTAPHWSMALQAEAAEQMTVDGVAFATIAYGIAEQLLYVDVRKYQPTPSAPSRAK